MMDETGRKPEISELGFGWAWAVHVHNEIHDLGGSGLDIWMSLDVVHDKLLMIGRPWRYRHRALFFVVDLSHVLWVQSLAASHEALSD